MAAPAIACQRRVVFDAGYDAPHMARLLAGLPAAVRGRMRADRVMRRLVPATWTQPRQSGRPAKNGMEFRFGGSGTWSEPAVATVQVTDRYGGTANAAA
ncbi:transposase [Streptomyces sp. HNM0663]|uniref:Transposase n=1 Tax=Streptomyces chengmaiensis TaxID=3040919 RepID=A0ABT6HRY8_9ACTN|nr:transposase [Streptomyces chengmaiensis]